MIVHAVAQRRHGRLEAQAVIRHAMKKTLRRFAAPAELARGDLEFRHARRQVSLDEARIHFLLRDGVADDGQPVPCLEQQRPRCRRLTRIELEKIRIRRFRLVVGRPCRARQVQEDDDDNEGRVEAGMSAGAFHKVTSLSCSSTIVGW